jgi:phosphopantetheinyl transferase
MRPGPLTAHMSTHHVQTDGADPGSRCGPHWLPGVGGPPRAGEIYIWSLTVTSRQQLDRGPLNDDEWASALRHRQHARRAAAVLARTALRDALGALLGCESDAVPLRRGRFGRPELATCQVPSATDFSISHAHGRVLVAVGRCGRIGIDIEHVNGRTESAVALRRFLPATDHARIRAATPSLQTATLLRCWTAREARAKADGRGLAAMPGPPMPPLIPGTFRPVPAWPGLEPWSGTELPASPQYVAALVTEHRPNALLSCPSSLTGFGEANETIKSYLRRVAGVHGTLYEELRMRPSTPEDPDTKIRAVRITAIKGSQKNCDPGPLWVRRIIRGDIFGEEP